MNKNQKTIEELNAEREEVFEMLNKGINDLYKGSIDNLDNFLENKTRLENFTPNNAILIMQQNPDFVHVARTKQFFDNKIGVKKGEKPIKTLQATVSRTFKDDGGNYKKVDNASKEEQMRIQNGDIKVYEKVFYRVSNVYDITQTICSPKVYQKYIGKNYDNYVIEVGQGLKDYLGMESSVQMTSSELIDKIMDSVSVNDEIPKQEKFEKLCIAKMLCDKYKIEDTHKKDRLDMFINVKGEISELAKKEDKNKTTKKNIVFSSMLKDIDSSYKEIKTELDKTINKHIDMTREMKKEQYKKQKAEKEKTQSEPQMQRA